MYHWSTSKFPKYWKVPKSTKRTKSIILNFNALCTAVHVCTWLWMQYFNIAMHNNKVLTIKVPSNAIQKYHPRWRCSCEHTNPCCLTALTHWLPLHNFERTWPPRPPATTTRPIWPPWPKRVFKLWCQCSFALLRCFNVSPYGHLYCNTELYWVILGHVELYWMRLNVGEAFSKQASPRLVKYS